MLYYVVLCCGFACYVMLCCVVLCRAAQCHIVFNYVVLSCFMLHYFTLHYSVFVMSCCLFFLFFVSLVNLLQFKVHLENLFIFYH